jgi:hypothetical protein
MIPGLSFSVDDTVEETRHAIVPAVMGRPSGAVGLDGGTDRRLSRSEERAVAATVAAFLVQFLFAAAMVQA